MKEARIWVVGLGTVGQWLLRALIENGPMLESRYGFVPRVVGVANQRQGFVFDAEGLDLEGVLEAVSSGRPLSELAARHWPTSVAGLGATDADVLVEVTGSDDSGEPGATHMRAALGRGISVVTSNKWPVALHGVELAALAREKGAAFRAESTVMSGTPVLSTLIDGLAGATPHSVRAILNATANFILTRMEEGSSYQAALTEAQDLGLAERDPVADVEGFDSVAKAMILAGLVFGQQLGTSDVSRTGITSVGRARLDDAAAAGASIKHLVTLGPGSTNATLSARIEPTALTKDDRLACVSGIENAVVCRAAPVGEITVFGPGAGPELAGQGVFSDLIAVARMRR